MPALAEDQVTVVGAFSVVTTVAVNCCVCPIVRALVAGETVMDVTDPIMVVIAAPNETQLVAFDIARMGVAPEPPSVRSSKAYFRIGMVAA
jgi:hypothetical protein